MSNPTPLTAPQRPRLGTTRNFSSFRAISALMLREMGTRYGRSPGGYIWAIVEPIGMITVMALAFSLLIPNPPLGNNFVMFYATGFMPFQVYQSLSTTISSAINFSKPLLQYPSVTWLDAVAARLILNSLTGVLVTLIVIVTLLIATDSKVSLNMPAILAAMGLIILIGAAVGLINCVLFSLFPIWQQIWGILSRPLVLASGVVFLYENLPPAVQDILWYNPLLHVLGEMRVGFYPTYRPDYVMLSYPLCCGLIGVFLGLVLLGRYHRDMLNNS